MTISATVLTTLAITNAIPATGIAAASDTLDNSKVSSTLFLTDNSDTDSTEKKNTFSRVYQGKIVTVKDTRNVEKDGEIVKQFFIVSGEDKKGTWVDKSELTKLSTIESKQSEDYQVKIIEANRTDGLYSSPFLTSDDSITSNQDAVSHNNQVVSVTQSAVVKNADGSKSTFLKVSIDGQDKWIDATGTTTELKSKQESLISQAMTQLGVPYVYAGTTMAGLDCSGFVDLAMSKAGLGSFGRTSYQQAATLRANGSTAHSLAEAQPGDLLFWGGAGSEYHVEIYLGNGQAVGATSPGKVSSVHSVWGTPVAYSWN